MSTKSEQSHPIAESVTSSINEYFKHLEGAPTNNLYELVIREVEKPLISSIMGFAQGNQSQAAKWLGISRNTLRKLIAKYGINGEQEVGKDSFS
jgi:Fis family transcriptional regulator